MHIHADRELLAAACFAGAADRHVALQALVCLAARPGDGTITAPDLDRLPAALTSGGFLAVAVARASWGCPNPFDDLARLQPEQAARAFPQEAAQAIATACRDRTQSEHRLALSILVEDNRHLQHRHLLPDDDGRAWITAASPEDRGRIFRTSRSLPWAIGNGHQDQIPTESAVRFATWDIGQDGTNGPDAERDETRRLGLQVLNTRARTPLHSDTMDRVARHGWVRCMNSSVAKPLQTWIRGLASPERIELVCTLTSLVGASGYNDLDVFGRGHDCAAWIGAVVHRLPARERSRVAAVVAPALGGARTDLAARILADCSA